MLRGGLLLFVALGLLLVGHAEGSAAVVTDFFRARPDCNFDQAAVRSTNRSVPYFVGCRYDAVRALLPPFTTVEWESSDKAPLGVIIAQSASPGLNVTRLGREFTIAVSTGPRISVGNAIAFEGEVLAFKLSGRPQVPPDSPFELQFRLATDPSGETAAVEGRDYAEILDRDFARGGTLEVETLEGGGTEQLYLFVLLRFAADDARTSTILARGLGRIVSRPRVTLFDAMAREGEDLRFLAMIDRGIAARGALTYRVAIDPGTAVAGSDFVPPEQMTITFEPGENAVYFSVPTLDNAQTSEDRQLQLMAGIAGQPMAVARGTILNATPAIAPAGNATGDQSTDTDPLLGIGLDWLAAIGAAAIGILAGFVFGARKTAPATPDDPADVSEPQLPAPPALVVGWATETTQMPQISGGNLSLDGPSIAIDVTSEVDAALPLDSLPILPESSTDA